MKKIYANNFATLLLGHHGENLARQVVFDVRDLESLYGPGDVEVIYQRHGDAQPYPLAVQRDGTLVTWDVTATDTEISDGSGKCELRYYGGETLAKSKTWRTLVEPALPTPSETAPPEPEQGWVDKVISAGAEAKQAADRAENAVVHAPIIGDNGNWFVWDSTTGAYIDTGRYSGGSAPYIGANGNWFIGTNDSGVSATGPAGPSGRDGADGQPGRDGRDGADGADGQPGRDGVDGKDGVSVTHSWSGTTLNITSSSGTSSANLKGEKGDPGTNGKDGQDYVLTADDRNEIAGIVETNITPTLTDIRETAEKAETIARGRATGYVFDTLEDLETALTNEEFVAGLVLGDNLYIRATDVPDYWWDGTAAYELEAEKPVLDGFITDVQMNGVSVVSDGVATIPVVMPKVVRL